MSRARWGLLVALVAGGALAAGVAIGLRRQPAAREDSRSIVQAVERVAKLATVEMSISNWRLRRDSKPLFGFLPIACEKTVAVLYRGKVAAGIDLTLPGALDVSLVDHAPGRRAVVSLAAPQVLYLDVPAPELLVTDGSLCNRLEPDEYARLHEEARAAVRADAIEAGLLDRAEAQARALVAEVLRPLGYDVDVNVAHGDVAADASPRR
jgi:hypothetical protein